MEFDNDRKLHHTYTSEIFFWTTLVILNPLVTTITMFWFMPSFSVGLLFISVFLFPAYLLYARLIVPKFLFQKKYFLFILTSIVFFILVQLLSAAIHSFILQFSLELQEQFYLISSPRTIIRDGLWILIYICLCTAFSFYKKTIDEHELVAELKKDNTLFRLKYLQSQLNPHFLFNTLNSIYSLSLQKSDEAPDLIIKLADIMRYLIYECNEQKIALEKEIEFIKSYIEIEKIRYKAEVRFIIEGETKNIMIEPFLFIAFIENGFKHAMNDACENPFIYITIKADERKIELNVINNTNIDLETQSKRINGTGIKNSRSLLEILYPESHALNIIQTDIQPKQNSLLRMKNARERLEMYYPDTHTLDAILKNNAFTVSLIVNRHAQ
jgi:two-component system, LytTR family, sensor kinase